MESRKKVKCGVCGRKCKQLKTKRNDKGHMMLVCATCYLAMDGEVRKVGKENDPIWSTRLNGNKGNPVFMNENIAEALMKKGNLVLRKCYAGDLR